MIWPPRPEQAIAPSLISFYERRGWIAQIKKNGTCTVVSIDPKGAVDFKTRHGTAHKAWEPTDEIIKYFANFPDSIFVCELLHSKHESVKNTLYVFDVLKYRGKDLIGTKFKERQDLLQSVVPIKKNILLARNYSQDLTGLFRSLQDPIDEGLVLKDPEAPLRSYVKKSSNAGWQVKCRVPHLNYGF